jgi:hypothetical protein
VGEVGVVSGDFHRLKGASANESHKNSQSNQAFCAFFLQPCFSKNTSVFFFKRVLKAGEREAVPGLHPLPVRVQFLRQFADAFFLRLAAKGKGKRIKTARFIVNWTIFQRAACG